MRFITTRARPGEPGVSLRTALLQGANGVPTRGSAAIVLEAGAHRLELGSDFETEESNALDVRLCTDPDCTGGQLNLGKIASRGAQSFPMPDDGAAFSHVVIWCRAIDLAFGFGVLQ